MKLKTILPIQVLYFEVQTSLSELSNFVRVEAKRLYLDAIKNNLEITGPVYWQYEGADGKPDTIFTLTIALPIASAEESIDSRYKTKYFEPFDCLSTELYGNWSELGQVYGAMFQNLAMQRLAPTGVNREIYINMDFEHPERNITEIQIGVFK